MDKAFKAHSVRGALASAAMNRGVSLSDILSTADWSKESTFRDSIIENLRQLSMWPVLQGDTSAENW